jgi:hypothetical protein
MDYVDSVSEVRVRAEGNGRYSVRALGSVPTGGWTQPTLIHRHGFVSAEGTLDLDFMAEKPTGYVIQGFQDVRATTQFGGPGTDLNGLHTIRVFYRRNKSYDVQFNPC